MAWNTKATGWNAVNVKTMTLKIQLQFDSKWKIKGAIMIVCMSNFECFSVTVPTLFILNLDYFLCDIRYCCTRVKTRNTAHSWVDPHTPSRAAFFLEPTTTTQAKTHLSLSFPHTSSLRRQPFLPRSSPLGAFREEERLQLSYRNSVLMTLNLSGIRS